MADTTTTPTTVPAPNFKFQAPTKLGKLDTFLIPSKTDINKSKYDKAKIADIEENIKAGYIKSDAENDTDQRYALHTLLTGGAKPSGMVPNEKSLVNIDTNAMRANIASPESGLSTDDQLRYGRALQIFDKIVENKFNVMKGPGGEYWIESLENGKKVYAVNGIREVAELVDRFNIDQTKEEAQNNTVPGAAPTIPTLKPKKLSTRVAENPDADNFTDSEKWYLRSMATDALSSIAGVAGKAVTAGTGGAGFMAGIAGTAASVTGGLASLGMSMYGDYLDKDVSNGEMWTNAGVRLGLEAMETVSVIPASLLGGLSTATKTGKVLRKAIQMYMLSGVVTTAVATDWTNTMDKIVKGDGDVEDWRKLATMFQFVVGSVGSSIGRNQTKKNISKNTEIAHEPYADFSKGKLATKQEIAANPKFNRMEGRVATLKARTEASAAENSALAKTTAKTNVVKLNASKRKEIAAAKKLPPVKVDEKGQTALDFDSPIVDVKPIQAKYKTKIAEEKAKLNTETAKIQADKEARVALLDTRKEAGTAKLTEKLVKVDADKVGKLHKEHTAAGKTDLDKTIETSMRENGSMITKRLIRKGEAASGVPEATLAASKNQAPAPVTATSKEKLLSLTKNKKEIEASIAKGGKKKSIAANKEKLDAVEKEIAEEVKRTTGVRGAGNKLVANTKKGFKASIGGVSSLASRVAAVPNFVASSNGVNNKTLVKAHNVGDHMVGDQFYEYDMPTAKARLVEEGYTPEEINKYSLRQLRAVLHDIEQERADGKAKLIPKKTTTKRPKILAHRNGGILIPKYQYGASIGMATNYDPSVLPREKDRTGYDQSFLYNKLLGSQKPIDSVWAKAYAKYKNTPKPPAKPIDALTNIAETIINPVGELNNVDIDKVEEEKRKAVIKADEEDKKIIADKYDAIIAAAKNPKSTSKGFDYSQLLTLIGEFKSSDLFMRNRIFVEPVLQENVSSPVLHSNGVNNMPGFNESINRSTLMPRTDTADSFAANSMKLAMSNEGEKRRAELVARNAQYVDNSRREDLAVKNQNIASATEAENANVQNRNRAEEIYSSGMAQAKAQQQMANNQRNGRLANALSTGIKKLYTTNRQAGLTNKFNEIASIKSKWNNESAIRFKKAAEAGNKGLMNQIKAEFIQETTYDPDDLDRQLMDIKGQFNGIT